MIKGTYLVVNKMHYFWWFFSQTWAADEWDRSTSLYRSTLIVGYYHFALSVR